MGYHRDPDHFQSLSPCQREMRRRMWAIVCSLDIGFSIQMGLPSTIKQSLSDTMPPQNLNDHDFDACLNELPPARPISELTSSTVIIAKLHVAISMGAISDTVCNPHPLSYENLVEANSRLDVMYATIPDPCRFRPMSESPAGSSSRCVSGECSTPFKSRNQSATLATKKDTTSRILKLFAMYTGSAIETHGAVNMPFILNSDSTFTCITKELGSSSTGNFSVPRRICIAVIRAGMS